MSIVFENMSSKSFVCEIAITEKLIDMMRDVSRDLAMRAVMECGKQYNFSGEEAIRMLGLGEVNVKTTKGKSIVVKEKKDKSVKKMKVAKASFPLPFSGVMNEMCCHGLKSNHGLYTQCMSPKGEGAYCKSCEMQASKNANGKPDCGDVEDRVAVGLYEFKDSKGKGPVAYTKIMKKLNLSKEDVIAEALKMNVSIPEEHFEVKMSEAKRGRPKSDKVEKEPKGAKGRPKKTKKVLELEGEEDLFSALVAKANNETKDEVEVAKAPEKTMDKALEKAAKEAEKAAAKEAEKAAAKAAKEAAKEAEKAAAKAAKEAEKAAKEAAKEAEKAAAKAAKEAEKAAAKAAKEASKPKKSVSVSKAVEVQPVAVAVEATVEEDEPDVVKKIEYEGKKYLKSKKTGIIYNMEQDVVGKWNNDTNKIDFMDEEECESEYEE